jgi:hypothetical protein
MPNVGDFIEDADGRWQVTRVKNGEVTGQVLVEPSAEYEAAREEAAIPPERPPSRDELLADVLEVVATDAALADRTKTALTQAAALLRGEVR